MTVTHIAGLAMTVEDRYLRQRCAWCGAILHDYDLTMLGFPESTPPEERTPGTWQAGILVTVDGPASWALDPDAKLPDDACTLVLDTGLTPLDQVAAILSSTGGDAPLDQTQAIVRLRAVLAEAGYQ